MAGSPGEASSNAQRIFENIIFLEEVFVGRTGREIPDVPVLELARSFELKRPDPGSAFTGGKTP